MEESQILWKDYLIIRQGPYWVVRNKTRYIGGSFTTLNAAKRFVDAKAEDDRIEAYNKGLREIRKMPIGKRKKEYEKLCQTLNIS